MNKIKKNFGFGVMRFPLVNDQVVYEDFCRMVDAFMGAGFNYFDTARVYLGGKSEIALRQCLVKRYDREDFVLVDKLSSSCFEKEEEIRPFFESQLESLGVDYIDIYLMHAQNAGSFEKYKVCRAYEIAEELKREGKIRHYGLSFHDSAEVLDRILTEYPSVEVVQLQFNYLDYEDERVQARLCYETCVRHGKPVIVMEPVRGGALANLPPVAGKYFSELGEASPASYAIRYAAGFENVMMVLSGMSNMEQVQDNISYMADFKPLSEREMQAVNKVCAIMRNSDVIRCTACSYCTDGCPAEINIPAYFARSNAAVLGMEYEGEIAGGKPEACLQCGQCEGICPQKLKITELLAKL